MDKVDNIKEELELDPSPAPTKLDGMKGSEAFTKEKIQELTNCGYDVINITTLYPRRLEAEWYEDLRIVEFQFRGYTFKVFCGGNGVYLIVKTGQDTYEDIYHMEDLEPYGVVDDETLDEFVKYQMYEEDNDDLFSENDCFFYWGMYGEDGYNIIDSYDVGLEDTYNIKDLWKQLTDLAVMNEIIDEYGNNNKVEEDLELDVESTKPLFSVNDEEECLSIEDESTKRNIIKILSENNYMNGFTLRTINYDYPFRIWKYNNQEGTFWHYLQVYVGTAGINWINIRLTEEKFKKVLNEIGINMSEFYSLLEDVDLDIVQNKTLDIKDLPQDCKQYIIDNFCGEHPTPYLTRNINKTWKLYPLTDWGSDKPTKYQISVDNHNSGYGQPILTNSQFEEMCSACGYKVPITEEIDIESSKENEYSFIPGVIDNYSNYLSDFSRDEIIDLYLEHGDGDGEISEDLDLDASETNGLPLQTKTLYKDGHTLHRYYIIDHDLCMNIFSRSWVEENDNGYIYYYGKNGCQYALLSNDSTWINADKYIDELSNYMDLEELKPQPTNEELDLEPATSVPEPGRTVPYEDQGSDYGFYEMTTEQCQLLDSITPGEKYNLPDSVYGEMFRNGNIIWVEFFDNDSGNQIGEIINLTDDDLSVLGIKIEELPDINNNIREDIDIDINNSTIDLDNLSEEAKDYILKNFVSDASRSIFSSYTLNKKGRQWFIKRYNHDLNRPWTVYIKGILPMSTITLTDTQIEELKNACGTITEELDLDVSTYDVDMYNLSREIKQTIVDEIANQSFSSVYSSYIDNIDKRWVAFPSTVRIAETNRDAIAIKIVGIDDKPLLYLNPEYFYSTLPSQEKKEVSESILTETIDMEDVKIKKIGNSKLSLYVNNRLASWVYVSDTGYIYYLETKKEMRGLGLGSILMEKAIYELGGYWLHIEEPNIRVQKWYESLGFVLYEPTDSYVKLMVLEKRIDDFKQLYDEKKGDLKKMLGNLNRAFKDIQDYKNNPDVRTKYDDKGNIIDEKIVKNDDIYYFYRGYDDRHSPLDNKESYIWITDDYEYAKEYTNKLGEHGKVAKIKIYCDENQLTHEEKLPSSFDVLNPGEKMFKKYIIDKGFVGYTFDVTNNYRGDYSWCLCILKDYCEVVDKDIDEESLQEKIVKKGSQWQVQSEKGRNMGTYDTKAEAEKRLKQVHYFKHVNEDLEKATPYMLRNDGELLPCGDVHPYIKYLYEANNLDAIRELLYTDDIQWFYNNTNKEDTKKQIINFLFSIINCSDMDEDIITNAKEVINDLGLKESDANIIKGIKQIESLFEELNVITNQEFCRARTSDLKYGGNSNDIYFRISSLHFNWFPLIWNVVANKNVDTVTVCKDTQTFGGKYDPYQVNGIKIDHLPKNEFLTLKGNPAIETLEFKSEMSKENFINFNKGLTLSESCFHLQPRYALGFYKTNINERLTWDMNNILQPNNINEDIDLDIDTTNNFKWMEFMPGWYGVRLLSERAKQLFAQLLEEHEYTLKDIDNDVLILNIDLDNEYDGVQSVNDYNNITIPRELTKEYFKRIGEDPIGLVSTNEELELDATDNQIQLGQKITATPLVSGYYRLSVDQAEVLNEIHEGKSFDLTNCTSGILFKGSEEITALFYDNNHHIIGGITNITDNELASIGLTTNDIPSGTMTEELKKSNNTFIYNGKQYWCGSVNVLDGKIEEVHTYKEAKENEFHHSFYFSEQQLQKMEDGECAFFFIDNGKIIIDPIGRVDTKFDNDFIIKEIEKQIKVLNEDLDLEPTVNLNNDDIEVIFEDNMILVYLHTIKAKEELYKILNKHYPQLDEYDQAKLDNLKNSEMAYLYKNNENEIAVVIVIHLAGSIKYMTVPLNDNQPQALFVFKKFLDTFGMLDNKTLDIINGQTVNEQLTESKKDRENFSKWANDSKLEKDFYDNQQRLDHKDIYYWISKDPSELRKAIDDLRETNKEEREQAMRGASKLMLDNPYWEAYIINTVEASKLLGKGTKWCISGTSLMEAEMPVFASNKAQAMVKARKISHDATIKDVKKDEDGMYLVTIEIPMGNYYFKDYKENEGANYFFLISTPENKECYGDEKLNKIAIKTTNYNDPSSLICYDSQDNEISEYTIPHLDVKELYNIIGR